MNISKVLMGLFFISALGFFSSCNKEEEEEPTTGFVEGVITDLATGEALANARVTVFNSNDNTPIASMTSDASGLYRFELDPGSYYIKVSGQGYLPNPSAGITAVPFSIAIEQVETRDVLLIATDNSDAGMISGTVTSGEDPVSGALIVAQSADGSAFSGITDQEGNYIIFNVPAGSFDVSAWMAGYNATPASAEVSVGSETADIAVALTNGASGVLTGQVSNLASENKDVDVALIHPVTGETIPGLISRTVDQNYTIENIPDGDFIARATFENDQRVMDPDRIFKFGEPEVSIAGGSQSIDFDVTNSVTINGPTNESNSTIPMETTEAIPTFSWSPYSSTSDYVIEVTDASTGVVVWGGFDESGELPVKNITIPNSTLSITFNEDGSASIPQLEAGRVYRWRVYASKDDTKSPTGWTLISASEDQMGLIKIME